MKRETALAYVMDLLGVGGKELAMEINTDTTTVSKWRTGRRKLLPDSQHCRAIAAFFLSDRFSVCRKELEKQLDLVIDGFPALPYEKKLDGLCYVLSREDLRTGDGSGSQRNQASYRAGTQIYSGDYQGWKLSIEQFWNVSLTSAPTQITLCDFGDIDWSTTEPERFLLTSDYVIACVKKGHRVCIVDILGNSYRSYEVLGRWMSMYMTDGVELRYIIGNFTDAEKGSYYCVRDKLMLVGYYFENKPDLMTYAHYTDYRMRRYYQARVENYLVRSQPVFSKLRLAEHMETVNIMEQNLNAFDPTYMICPMPTYINMPPALLEEILEQNGVDRTQIERCMDIVTKRHDIRHRCRYIQMYDLDAIEKWLQHKEWKVHMLSRIIGRPIFMTKQQYLRQLQYISETLERGEMEIDLISFKDMGITQEHMSVVAQAGHLAIIWDDSRYENLIYSTEPTYVGGFVSYLEDLHASIPPMNKNLDWVKRRFQEYVTNG